MITVTNEAEIPRTAETVQVSLTELRGISSKDYQNICIRDENGKQLLSQLIDMDSDSVPEYIIFQADFEANETKEYIVVLSENNEVLPEENIRTFCRFVPERMDDFAWENDRIAFRTYGPECQKMFENETPGGLISSGIDCWLKRVNYPVIDKWYRKHEQGGSYHVDEGEGLDNYHVGTTRGCGGTALYVDGNYVLSENFSRWRIIANGPIRSVFELEYPPYAAGSMNVREKKIFTIDLGTNFYQCKVKYECTSPVGQAAVGIAHHNSDGAIAFDKDNGYMTFWEPLDDSFLGTAIIVDLTSLSVAEVSTSSDSENHWVHLKPRNNSFSYRAGFCWEKSGPFLSELEWKKFVIQQSRLIHVPLKIQIRLLKFPTC